MWLEDEEISPCPPLCQSESEFAAIEPISNSLTVEGRKVREKRPFVTNWFFADFVGMTLLEFFFLLPLPNSFLKVYFLIFLAAVLNLFLPLTTSAISDAAIGQVSNYAFSSWNDVFLQIWNCNSPNKFCMCTESPSTFPTNTFIELNLYLSRSNHSVTSFRLERNAGVFSKHQNKTSGTERYKGFFSPLVPLKSILAIGKKILCSGLNCR